MFYKYFFLKLDYLPAPVGKFYFFFVRLYDSLIFVWLFDIKTFICIFYDLYAKCFIFEIFFLNQREGSQISLNV